MTNSNYFSGFNRNEFLLLQLAEHLYSVPQYRFSMKSYRSATITLPNRKMPILFRNPLPFVTACSLGHAPAIIPTSTFRTCKYYANDLEYSLRKDILSISRNERIFEMVSIIVFGIVPRTDEFDFLFCKDWYYTDNTPKGAAQRIFYFLENGLPENWKDQMLGTAEISYRDSKKYTRYECKAGQENSLYL